MVVSMGCNIWCSQFNPFPHTTHLQHTPLKTFRYNYGTSLWMKVCLLNVLKALWSKWEFVILSIFTFCYNGFIIRLVKCVWLAERDKHLHHDVSNVSVRRMSGWFSIYHIIGFFLFLFIPCPWENTKRLLNALMLNGRNCLNKLEISPNRKLFRVRNKNDCP